MINAKMFVGNNRKYQLDNFNMLLHEEGGLLDRPLIVQVRSDLHGFTLLFLTAPSSSVQTTPRLFSLQPKWSNPTAMRLILILDVLKT